VSVVVACEPRRGREPSHAYDRGRRRVCGRERGREPEPEPERRREP
jgi:hypothetical protein